MNSLLTQPSPSRPPQNRGGAGNGGGGGGDGTKSSRGTGRSRGRARGGVNGGSRLAFAKPINQSDLSLSPSGLSVQQNGETDSESADESEASRQQRFNKIDSGNQFEKLKIKREAERKVAVANGLIDDPDKPRSLSEAIRFVGTCLDMCPEFEMHQREYQNNVEKWEIDPQTGRIDKSRAVKAFHRPAAGNEQPLPSDVRSPSTLVKTLDYLFSSILEGDDIYATHAFIRDRTRSIRQDFTVQNDRGREAIECHERIARYHILCLHALCDNANFSEQQEMEQLRKVLQSLMEFYKDTKMSSSPLPLPNETEFRAYFALVFLRDHDVSRQLQTLSEDIFFSAPMMRSLGLRCLAQRSNDKFVQNNAEAAPNSFVRFFKEVQKSSTFLESCILETWFGSIRTGAFKALRQALGVKAVQVSQVSVLTLVKILGFDDTEQLIAFCNYLGLEVVYDENDEPRAIWFKRSIPWEEPASYLHQFSRTIVESKRRGQTNQSIVNGLASRQQPSDWPSVMAPAFIPKSTQAQPFSPFSPAHPRLPTMNGANSFEKPKDQLSFTSPTLVQPKEPFETETQTVFSSVSSTVDGKSASKLPLSAPVPQRATKSPILNFQLPRVVTDTSEMPKPIPTPEASTDHISQAPHPAVSTFSAPFSTSFSTTIRDDTPKYDVPTRVLTRESLPKTEEPRPDLAQITARRQSLFERQEKLLHDELTQQERERQSKLDHVERERKKSLELTRQRTYERNLARQRESALLKSQKMATKEREEQERLRSEQQKAHQEKNIQFYTEEIVNSIVQEHILEVEADVLAVAFHRKWLLTRVVRHLKKTCARSVGRKQLQLEEIKQTRNRKRLLARALSELDSGDSAGLNKKPRRRSRRIESEDALEEILNKASEASKALWKPLDLNHLLSPYVDAALTRGGMSRVEWNLLILLVEDEISEETRWLRTKFGFTNEIENRVRVASDVAQVSIIWSPVMQFSGSLDNLGALIFVYKGVSQSRDPKKPSAQALLHEVVRQTSLQSRYRHPVLVINFSATLTNASEVARELDLQALSQSTTSVPAFQVLTIGRLGEVNMDGSIRSFFRHVSGVPNENIQDAGKERKRKRNTVGATSAYRTSTLEEGLANDDSPPKKPRNKDGHPEANDATNKNLPKSIESLYKSIMSAQKELEAGRSLNEHVN